MAKIRMTHRVERGDQRDNILNAAERVFARNGSAATMAEVASDAGVSQGLAYRYFASKEEILATLVKRAAKSGGGPAERINKIRGTPTQRLALLISYIVQDRRERPEFNRFLYQVLADENVPTELRNLVRKNGRVIQEIIRKLIIEGQAEGEIAKDDPEQLLQALMACVDGLVRRAELFGRNGMNEHYPEAKIFLRMLRPDAREGGANPR
ncbi:MAG: TetR/AcrR family transcriptional regulator [Nitrososphaerales archaeon]